MNKALSIITVVVFIASGMHITFASHYCEGKLAAIRISVTGKKATCGMEVFQPEKVSANNVYQNNCCEDNITAFLLGYYENTDSLELSIPGQNTNHLLWTPCFLSINQNYIIKCSDLNVSPPGTYCIGSPSCSALCLFRI